MLLRRLAGKLSEKGDTAVKFDLSVVDGTVENPPGRLTVPVAQRQCDSRASAAQHDVLERSFEPEEEEKSKQ